MKRLIIVGGTMGVGKTASCRALQQIVPANVFLDGDWCWDARPFVVTDETKTMVLDNIRHLLSGFLRCAAYETIIFCWVLHEREILDDVLRGLPLDGVSVEPTVLVCTPAILRARLQADIDAGVREPDVLARSLARLPLYQKLGVPELDTSTRTPEETARILAENHRRPQSQV